MIPRRRQRQRTVSVNCADCGTTVVLVWVENGAPVEEAVALAAHQHYRGCGS